MYERKAKQKMRVAKQDDNDDDSGVENVSVVFGELPSMLYGPSAMPK